MKKRRETITDAQVERIRLRLERADPASWDQLESGQIMRDLSVMLYKYDAAIRASRRSKS